jgi:hypothetical protein
METRPFTIEKDALPLCLVGRIDAQQSGIFLPASTLAMLRHFLEESTAMTHRTESQGMSLAEFVREILSVHANTATWTENTDVKEAVRQLGLLQKMLGDGDDGPGRA